MHAIETERLTLREFTSEDAVFLLRLLNSPTWLRFIGDREVRSMEDALVYIQEKFVSVYKKWGFGFYLTQLKEGSVPIGMCGLVKRDYLEDVDVGFAFLPEYTGKGYAFEAAQAVLDFAKERLHLDRIIAVTGKDNNTSIHLLKKLGMHFEKMVHWPENNENLLLFARRLNPDGR